MVSVDRSRLPARHTRTDDRAAGSQTGASRAAEPQVADAALGDDSSDAPDADARRASRLPPVPGARRTASTRAGDATETGWRLVALLTIIAAGGCYLYLAVTKADRGLAGAIVFPLVVLAGLAIVQLLVRSSRPTYDLAGIAGTGLGLRLIGAYLRFSNPVDAVSYHNEGVRLADSYRALDFSADPGREIPGTGALRVASGVVHVITFDDFLVSLLVFTLASFAGACLLVRALQVGFPEADQHRYALLIFLLPSLAYWPSSLGKEAWMLLGLGIFALGAAHLYRGATTRGLLVLVLGLTLLTLVRPHVAVLALGALGIGFLGTGTARTRVRTAARIVGILLLVVGGAVLSRSAAERLQIDSLGTDEVNAAQERTAESTSDGNSAFQPTIANDPVSYGVATVTVLFRPFPGEVATVEGILPGLESLLIVGLLATSWRRFGGFWDMLRRHHYLLLCITFTLGFIWAFSAIGNFGILTRQRAQVLPFFLVLAALPPVAAAVRPARRRLVPGPRSTTAG